MNLNSFDRRRFIVSTLTLAAYSSCKKIDINPAVVPPIETEPINSTPPVQSNNSIEDDYLGQFLETEYGPDLAPNDFSKIIVGYSDKFSYKPGEKVTLYLSGAKNGNQKINLTDQAGNIVFSFLTPIDVQNINPDKPWINGFAFNKTATVTLPSGLKSGLYYWTDNIPLICKGTDPTPDVVVVYPTNTILAYCQSGGKSLYKPQDAIKTSRACVVSTQRYTPPEAIDRQTNCFFLWMMQQSYRVKYISDMDIENYAEIQNAKTLMVIGHSEYWTRKGRQNFDKFVASGKNAFVLSGNTMFYQVRHNLQKNTMICYKSDYHDPLRQTPYSTILWDTPFLNYPIKSSIGADFDGGGYADRLPNRLNGFKVVSENSPLLKGTGLKNGDVIKLPTSETDGAPVKKVLLPGSNETPEIDNDKLNFYRIELLAYDFTLNSYNKPGLGTFIVFKKTETSGTIVNTASDNWCSFLGIGGKDKTKIQAITKNMIDLSLNNQSLFNI